MGDRFLLDAEYRSRYGAVAGMDEAGRGPLAGPLVACAVLLPGDFDDERLNDSKKLTDRRRRELKKLIEVSAERVALGVVTPREIDRNRMSWAVRTSFNRAIQGIEGGAALFLVDGNGVPGLSAPARFLVKGDSRSLSIAAASIVAKVSRDDMMMEADRQHPGYGFSSHKGYGTCAHVRAIRELGPSPIHRMSFEPLKSMFETGQMDLFGKRSNDPGGAAEGRAAQHMERLGYTVLHRNWSCPEGEIDLILQKDDVVLFAEVKYTGAGDLASALCRIGPEKARRIRAAARCWLADSSWKGDSRMAALAVSPDSVEMVDF